MKLDEFSYSWPKRFYRPAIFVDGDGEGVGLVVALHEEERL